MLMLFVFTANQVAVAFEQCDDPSCSLFSGDVSKKTENNKKESNIPTHCVLGGHHVANLPTGVAMAPQTVGSATPFWAELTMPESVIGEGLIEPPSLA